MFCSQFDTNLTSVPWTIIKVGLSPSKKVGFIRLNESSLKMMKNTF